MATVVGNKVQNQDGTLVTPQQGGWYDGQQYWGGTLSSPGQFNSLNNQPGQQGGQAPVQNSADAAYLTAKGDTGANNALVTKPAPTPQQTTQNYTQGSSTPGTGIGSFTPPTQPTIDLTSLYDNIEKTSGINDLQKQLANETTSYNNAQSVINDNPFLSEGSRTGRGEKLSTDFENASANINAQISQTSADNQVKIGLAKDQYNIDNANYQQTVSQFNNLLTSGALNNASPTDIANIAVATGLTTSMVQDVIDSSKAKDVKPPQLMTIDDGTNQKLIAVDPTTGNIISTQILGTSKPTKTTGGSGKPTAADNAKQANSDMASLIGGGLDGSGQYNAGLVKGSDGKLSPQAYDYYLSLWTSEGLSTKDFESQFGYLKNPDNPYY